MDNETKKLLKDVMICIDNIEKYVGTEKYLMLMTPIHWFKMQ